MPAAQMARPAFASHRNLAVVAVLEGAAAAEAETDLQGEAGSQAAVGLVAAQAGLAEPGLRRMQPSRL